MPFMHMSLAVPILQLSWWSFCANGRPPLGIAARLLLLTLPFAFFTALSGNFSSDT